MFVQKAYRLYREKLTNKQKKKSMPGCLRAAENTCHISPTAISEGVHTSSELSCYLKQKSR